MVGASCLPFPTQKKMKTKTEHHLTVHLDNETVRVTKLGSLLSFHAEGGDALHIFLSVEGFEELRKLLEITTPQGVFS